MTIIDTLTGKIKLVNHIDTDAMQRQYEGRAIIIDEPHGRVLYGEDWITVDRFNELVESGEAIRMTAN